MSSETDVAQEVPDESHEFWQSANVLVTGGTGFLGRSLVRLLLARGARARVLARSSARARLLAEAGTEVVIGDVTDPAAVEAAVDGVQIVYHLAGQLFAPWLGSDVYRHVHVDGTRLLLDSARAAKVARFVHCSTTGVLGVTGDVPVAEDAPLRPTNAYEATKAKSEELVALASYAGLSTVIARPGLVYGPGDLHLLSFFASVLGRRFRPIGRKPVWLHPIYVDDLVAGLLSCGKSDRAVGESFNLAGPELVSLAQLARAVCLASGIQPTSGFIPLPAAYVAAKLGDVLPRALRERAPLTSSRLAFLTHSRVYDIEKAMRLLGFTASTGLTDGITTTIAWYRENGYLPLAGARL